MESNSIKGAVINKVWYDTARKLIPEPERRCEFYELILQAAFGQDVPSSSDVVVNTMWEMVRPYVCADVERYARRCEINRENAQKKRMGASGCESVRVGASGSEPKKTESNSNSNSSSSIITKNNTKNNIPLDEESEKFIVKGIMFDKGAANVQGEFNAFWSYYESLGWKNKNGSPIVNRQAAARMWRINGEICEKDEWRAIWYKSFKTATITDDRVWTNILSVSLEKRGEGAVLALYVANPDTFVPLLEDKCTAQMRMLMASYAATSIEYRAKL